VKSRRRIGDTRKRQEQRRGWLLIALSLVVVGTMAVTAMTSGSVDRDETTGCPLGDGAPPPSHTVVLVDQTDALPPDELDFARALIKNEYHWLPEDGVLTVRTLRADPSRSGDAIVVCRMRDGAEANEFTENRKAVQRDFERMAGAQLEQFLARMAQAETESASPLIEEIIRIYRRQDFGEDVKGRRLVLLSDMLQHSAQLSQYGRWTPSRGLPASLREEADMDMRNIDVRVQYVRRPGNGLQGKAHEGFWKKFFEERGARTAIGHSLALGESADRPVWRDTRKVGARPAGKAQGERKKAQ
jgi:hypothetical protein